MKEIELNDQTTSLEALKRKLDEIKENESILLQEIDSMIQQLL